MKRLEANSFVWVAYDILYNIVIIIFIAKSCGRRDWITTNSVAY